MKKPKNELSPKHHQALDLIRSGDYTYRDIAKMVGWSEDYLQKLIAGDAQLIGTSAVLFSQAVKEYKAEQAKRIKELTRNTKETILKKFEEFALEHKHKKIDADTRKEMLRMLEVISKATPKVEIGSFTYTQGLSVEDILNEFRRLKGLAADGARVSPFRQGESGEIPGPEAPGDPS